MGTTLYGYSEKCVSNETPKSYQLRCTAVTSSPGGVWVCYTVFKGVRENNELINVTRTKLTQRKRESATEYRPRCTRPIATATQDSITTFDSCTNNNNNNNNGTCLRHGGETTNQKHRKRHHHHRRQHPQHPEGRSRPGTPHPGARDAQLPPREPPVPVTVTYSIRRCDKLRDGLVPYRLVGIC